MNNALTVYFIVAGLILIGGAFWFGFDEYFGSNEGDLALVGWSALFWPLVAMAFVFFLVLILPPYYLGRGAKRVLKS